MKQKKKTAFILIYLIFIALSFFMNFPSGKKIGNYFFNFFKEIVIIFPLIFIIIGLFEVWIKKETVEKHLGEDAGFKSFLWAILLGGTTIGPMIVCLPIAYTLQKKGARLNVILTYIGAASVCRIPMTIFEASYLGVAFTITRYMVSIPLIIVTSILLANHLKRKNYKIDHFKE